MSICFFTQLLVVGRTSLDTDSFVNIYCREVQQEKYRPVNIRNLPYMIAVLGLIFCITHPLNIHYSCKLSIVNVIVSLNDRYVLWLPPSKHAVQMWERLALMSNWGRELPVIHWTRYLTKHLFEANAYWSPQGWQNCETCWHGSTLRKNKPLTSSNTTSNVSHIKLTCNYSC